jgi:hypothetical protein
VNAAWLLALQGQKKRRALLWARRFFIDVVLRLFLFCACFCFALVFVLRLTVFCAYFMSIFLPLTM